MAHAAFVRWLALDLVRDADEAEDVAQEALLRAIERPPAILRSVKSWLAGVTRNVVRMRRRAAARRVRRELAAARPEGSPSAADSAATMEVLRRVTAAVDELPGPYRATVILRYYEQRKPAEISRRTGVPLKTVKTRLNRALAMLRERLDERHGSRRAWALLLAPLTKPPGPAPIVPGAIQMSSTTKITLAAAASLLLLCAVVLSIGGVGDVPPAPGSLDLAASGPSDGSGATEGDAGPRGSSGALPGEGRTEAGLAPAEGACTVHVTVVDAVTGAPIPGVPVDRVCLEDELLHGGTEDASTWITGALRDDVFRRTAYADEEGRATHHAAPGPYVLLVRYPRYRDWLGESFPLRPGDEKTREIRLVPYPEGEREILFSGRVTDRRTGRPLAGAAVHCRYEEGRKIRRLEARTGRDGRYTLTVPVNALLVLYFQKEGYERDGQRLNPVQHLQASGDVALLPLGGGPGKGEARLTGIVTDETTGEPLDDAIVRLVRKGTDRLCGSVSRRGSGRYRIDVRPQEDDEEWVRVTVDRKGYVFLRSDPVALAPDRTTTLDFALKPETGDTGFTGTVTDARTGRPVPGARLRILDLFLEQVAAAAADEHGRFRLPFRGHERRVVVTADDYVELILEIREEQRAASGRAQPLDVALEPADCKLTGTVTDAATGKPLPGVAMSLYVTPEWSGPVRGAVTDEHGVYTFALARGRYLARAEREGYAPWVSRPVDAAVGETATADIALHAMSCAVTGRVRDAATGRTVDLPTGGLWIERLPSREGETEALISIATLDDVEVVTVEGARYRTRLAPGRYEVSVYVPGYEKLEREIELDAEDRRELDLELTSREDPR